MLQAAPDVPQRYFTDFEALLEYCSGHDTVPALVISLNHSIGMIAPHPQVLNPLRTILDGFASLQNIQDLRMLLCYQNLREGYQILNMPLADWITMKRRLLDDMQTMWNRQQEAEDRQLALRLDAIRLQELQDYQLALRLQEEG